MPRIMLVINDQFHVHSEKVRRSNLRYQPKDCIIPYHAQKDVEIPIIQWKSPFRLVGR